MRELAAPFKFGVPAGQPLRDQPIDVLLLGAILRGMSDLDRRITRTFAAGVPLGLGVDLPRTPDVFPSKRHWSPPEQPTWGGDSSEAGCFWDALARTTEVRPSTLGKLRLR